MNQIEFFSAKLEFEIDACDLNKQVIKNPDLLEIIDARSERAFNIEHIKGAISLPYGLMNEENVKHLDKNKIYISYCDGYGCNASTKGAYLLSKLGFNVKELIGGIESWKFEGHPVETNLTGEELEKEMACSPMCSCHN